MKSQVTLLLESVLIEKAEHEGGLSELVSTLLSAHFEDKQKIAKQAPYKERRLTGFEMLADQPGSVDDFIARKAEEKELER